MIALALAAVALLRAQPVLVDVMKVPVQGDWRQALVHAAVPANPREVTCDILIAGAGMGGIGAAIRATERGAQVCLTEETDWVGGQATAGGVSALDEHRFIEISGATRSYHAFRRGIREHYRRSYSLTPAALAWTNFNPGACYVSSLCYEPKVGEAVLREMLRGRAVQLLLRTQVFQLERKGAEIVSALAWRFEDREAIRIKARFYLDATELGDLLPLAKVPYVVGSEAKADTQEPHAAPEPNAACVQSFTYPFAIERRDGERHTIAEPEGHRAIVDRQRFSLRMNYSVAHGWKGDVEYSMYGDDPPVPNNMSPGPFFSWRRLIAAKNFASGPATDIALMNWPRQDYAEESILDRTPEDMARILQTAKRTSYSFLYWLQKDMGHPELKLRPDIMGTADGLSKYPYIRESRRLRAEGRVVEQDIVEESQPGPRARWFEDSIGTAFYMVDIHPCGANERGRMMMPRPFQIPLGTLLPQGVTNLLAAGKSIGVTHLTNGAFRLHPVEWNIGEAAAAIATVGMGKVEAVQAELAKAGVPLVWFDDLATGDADFAAIQLAAMRRVYPLGASDLHASPDAPVTRAEAAMALSAWFGPPMTREDSIRRAVREGWMAVDHRNWFHPDLPFYWTDWREPRMPKALPAWKGGATGPVRRRELAARLFGG